MPECLLLAAFFYFALRKLGSFPAAWADDSLFMLVAKMVAEGRGFALPILGYDWVHPSVLAVGPTLIYPVALSIKMFGFSVAAARLPMPLFLAGATIASYLFAMRTFDRTAARWTAALFISLSAFINTGKPVLGEVPAFFFLMEGLLILQHGRHSFLSAAGIGTAFGLAIVTKLPYGLLLPALGTAWIYTAIRRDTQELLFLTVAGAFTVAVAAIGSVWMGLGGDAWREIRIFLFERRSVVPSDRFVAIVARPGDLLRSAYAHYALIVLLACGGFWTVRRTMRRSLSIVIISCAALFAAYFLSGPGWYRALLPSTLLLLPFVPAGARSLVGRYGSVALLGAMILAQGYWQITGRGSSPSPEAAEAAEVLQEQWQNRDLVILAPEVFVRLSENPHWLFLSEELRDAERRPPEVSRRIAETRCIPLFRKESHEDLETKRGTFMSVSGRYVVFDPPADCSR